MALIGQEHRLEEIPGLLFAELRKGTVQKKHPFRNVVLSTVRGEEPTSRWVVFRKLTDEHRFLVYTDARSQKVAELSANPHCSLLFYHDRQGLQIRVAGTAVVHQDDALARKSWLRVQGSAVKNYTTILPPGSVVRNSQEGNRWMEPTIDDHFAIIEITPDKMDVLQLDRAGNIRAEFKRREEFWEGRFLVP
jgi:pyridoxine/pyridoxamine 5'-phosphate oxidase